MMSIYVGKKYIWWKNVLSQYNKYQKAVSSTFLALIIGKMETVVRKYMVNINLYLFRMIMTCVIGPLGEIAAQRCSKEAVNNN